MAQDLLAAMANYIDAGSIVAGAVSLPLWAKHSASGTPSFPSSARSAHAIAAGLGALVGGRICDLFGRKKIYQWDLLLYAFGTLWIVFAPGVDAAVRLLHRRPDRRRRRSRLVDADHRDRADREARPLAGLAQVLWYVGAIAPLILGIVLLDLDMLATRIIFAHLFVVALITWALRQGMTESALWEKAQGGGQRRGRVPRVVARARRRARVPDRHVRRLEPRRRHLWVLLPVHPRCRRHTSDRANLALQAIWFVSTALAVGVCLHAADRPRQPPHAAVLEHGAATRGLRAVHLLRGHVPHRADQRRAVRRRRGHRPAVAVPALERRAVPDAAALPPRASCSAWCGSRSAAGC